MANKTYAINYHIINKSGQTLKSKKPAKVKDAMNELHAKIKLEIFLKEKYPGFDKLVVVSCVEDNDFMSMFGDIFNNPLFK